MKGREGQLLMNVLSRMTTMMVLAMWVGNFRQLLGVIDEAGTVGTRTVLQGLASFLFIGSIVWALMQVRGFNDRTTDLEEQVARNREENGKRLSRFQLELEQADRILSRGQH
jgi:uncharacterized membrane protein YidH (DUF202 family)